MMDRNDTSGTAATAPYHHHGAQQSNMVSSVEALETGYVDLNVLYQAFSDYLTYQV